ncbi:hypothetical protein RFI_04663, partial [Reticulomyxa filosa]
NEEETKSGEGKETSSNDKDGEETKKAEVKKDEEDDDDDGAKDFIASLNKKKATNDKTTEGDDTDQEKEAKELDPDHRMLINCANNLVYSMNSAVVLGVVRLLYYCAPLEDCHVAVRALMEHLDDHREVSFCLLANVATMCAHRADLFSNYSKEFYIRATEPVYVKELKLDILSKIANENNINGILREFQAYVRDTDVKFRCATIDVMLSSFVSCCFVIYLFIFWL